MPSRTAAVADALVTWINDRPSRNWPAGIPNWKATREWEALEDISISDGLVVQVVSVTRRPIVLIARDMKDQGYEHEIYIREKYPEANEIPNEWIDLRVQLVESMEDQLFDMIETPPTGVDRVFVPTEDGVSIETMCDQFYLNELREFAAIISVVIRELRDR